jgi:hypothetical protein
MTDSAKQSQFRAAYAVLNRLKAGAWGDDAKQSQFGWSGRWPAGQRILRNKANWEPFGRESGALCETDPIRREAAVRNKANSHGRSSLRVWSGDDLTARCAKQSQWREVRWTGFGGHNMQNKANSDPFGSRPFVAAWGIFLCPLRICKNRALIDKNAVSIAPGGTRTPNPQLRRLMLYPIKLQAQVTV